MIELGAGQAINYRTEDVVARVLRSTGGRGVDLILDPIGGKGFGRNFAMLAPLGMVDLLWPARRAARGRPGRGDARPLGGEPGGALVYDPQL